MDVEWQMTKFKETEIGKIPDNWGIVLVEGVAHVNELSIGKSFKHDEIEYIDIESVANGAISPPKKMKLSEAPSRAKRIVRDNDILISTVRPNLKHFAFVRFAKVNTIASTGFAVLSSKKIEPMFLYYSLTTDRYTNYLSAIADSHTSTYPSFNPDIIEKSRILNPPVPEQRAIAKVLSDLDAKIELNREMNATLESMAEALFKHWFVDFEFPDENGKPYKSSGGRMIESELGEIPEGWGVKPLDEIAEFLNGLALQKYPSTGNDYLPVIKIAELNRGINDSSDKASAEIDEKYVVKDGDILFAWSGSLMVVIWCGGKGALNQHLFKVTSATYPKWFVFQWIKQHLSTFQQIAAGKATTMGHIQRHHLGETKGLVPSPLVISHMNKIMNPILEEYITNEIESRNLANIRDSLLPRLMSGKIRVIDT